jgi:hypothetical protein
MNSRFTKSSMFAKGSVYTCKICGKKTRETGGGESNSEMCAYCLEEAYAENDLGDGICTQEEFDTRIKEAKKRYKR